MERKSIVIDIPDGMCIDESKSTFERIVFKKKSSFPKSWEEFCKNNKTTNEEYFISTDSKVFNMSDIRMDVQKRDYEVDKNLCKTAEEAEAFLALIQLKRLWHEYVDNESDKSQKYYICYLHSQNGDRFSVLERYCYVEKFLFFKFSSIELAQEFLNNFKDLFIKTIPLWN